MIKHIFLSILLVPSITLFSKNTVLFSPYDKPTTTLLSLIKETKKTLQVAMYCLTDKRIADALIEAHNRGVTLTLFLDTYSTDGYGKADMLADAGIDVFIFQPKRNINFLSGNLLEDVRSFDFNPIMHNKYAIFDSKKVWTGSFNWTYSADKRNWENALIINDKIIITEYEENFEMLREHCQKYVSLHQKLSSPSLREKIESALQAAKTDDELQQVLITILSHK